MKMKNKMILVLAVFLLAGFAAGALGLISFAGGEDGAAASGTDKLIGILVTKDSLDLMDMDAFARDHAALLVSGGEITEKETAPYEKKLYAAPISESHPTEDGGEYTTGNYVFEGLEGFALFAPTIRNGEDTYHVSSINPPFSDVALHINDSEGKQEISLSGKLWLAPDSAVDQLWVNPVYQEPGGKVYLKGGSDVMYTSNVQDFGGQSSMTMAETATQTMNGVETSYSAKIELSLGLMAAPSKIVLVQLDSNSAVLSRETYAPGALPQTITPLQDAAFLVLEQFGPGAGEPKRNLYQKSDTLLMSFQPREDGFCLPQSSEIQWGE